MSSNVKSSSLKSLNSSSGITIRSRTGSTHSPTSPSKSYKKHKPKIVKFVKIITNKQDLINKQKQKNK